MPAYEVIFARSARKEIEGLEETLQTRVMARIESLSLLPRPSGCRRIQGWKDLWRIRIGDYRVLYTILDEKRLIDVVAVRHRSDAYR